MRSWIKSRDLVAAMLAAALMGTPALAQGKGKGQDRDRERPELVRRKALERQAKDEKKAYEHRAKQLKRDYEDRQESLREDRERLERRDGRWDGDDWDDDRYEERGEGPKFCRSGEGHPVHGRRWCEQKGYGIGGYGGYGRDADYGRYEGGSYGSYEQAHAEFHRDHDRQCRIRAAERPLDIQWQLRVRGDCKRIHDDWHLRSGRRHD